MSQPQQAENASISTATTTASVSVKTSRLALGDMNKDKTKAKEEVHETVSGDQSDPTITSPIISSPTSSSSDDSRSSANIPSELLADDEDQDAEEVGPTNQALDITTPKSTFSSRHKHFLPTGWDCTYDPSTDKYSFEFVGVQEMAARPATASDTASQTRPKTLPSSSHQMVDQAITARTPTRDDFVQTSRRPTLEAFECKYGYHFPTSPTSSMISELAKQVQKSGAAAGAAKQPTVAKTRQIGYGKHKLVIPSEEAEQARRLHDMFPTAPEPIIEQMIRIYHGREGLIKAALISLGYKRSSEYSVQQATAQSPIMLMMSKPASKKLFDKLAGYFPDKDESLIKSLMYKHKEVEHEIISALVESGQQQEPSAPSSRHQHAHQFEPDRAIMKLRYLKFLYPTCEEIEIYHLLNCNDFNAQVVMELIEKRGHRCVNVEEVMQGRKSLAQQMRAQQAAHAAQDKAPASNAGDLVRAHVDRPKPSVSEARVAGLKANIKKSLEEMDDALIIGALKAADYNEPLARKFLQEMEPVDEALFKQRYEIPREPTLDVVVFPCKAVQKGDSSFMSIITNESVHIAREVVECKHALALLKVDAATFTQDDFPPEKASHRLGRRLGLAMGSTYKRSRTTGARGKLSEGPRAGLQVGAKYADLCEQPGRPKPNCSATGHRKSLVHGRNACLQSGHNPLLLQRTHPFFQPTVRG